MTLDQKNLYENLKNQRQDRHAKIKLVYHSDYHTTHSIFYDHHLHQDNHYGKRV